MTMHTRFRGYLPVIIDVETGGFDSRTDGLLEISAVIPKMNTAGLLEIDITVTHQLRPFQGANISPEALKFNQINMEDLLQHGISEKQGLQDMFKHIREKIKENGCTRAILTGHNAAFDLSFLNAAVARTQIKRNPFHPFSCLDTVSLGALALGETVLAKAVRAANIPFENERAHSAEYDAQKTAALFCYIINQFHQLGGWPKPLDTKSR